MTQTRSTKDAKKRYKKKILRIYVELYPTDTDVITQLTARKFAGEPAATYIKRLIRADSTHRAPLEG